MHQPQSSNTSSTESNSSSSDVHARPVRAPQAQRRSFRQISPSRKSAGASASERTAVRSPGVSTRPVINPGRGWNTWFEVGVWVRNLSPKTTTLELYRAFREEGNILSIDLFDDGKNARVRFSPAPRRAFWELPSRVISFSDGPKRLNAELEPQQRKFYHQSPITQGHFYPERLDIAARSLDFGTMFGKDEFMSMRSLVARPGEPVIFSLNLLRREIDVSFWLSTDNNPSSLCRYRFRLPFDQLTEIWEVDRNSNYTSMVIALDSPPNFYRKTHQVDRTHDPSAQHWHERMSWFRQTDIVQDRHTLKTIPVMLRKSKPVIDIGRWTVYRLNFNTADIVDVYSNVRRALGDYNIPVKAMPVFKTIQGSIAALWSWIDQPPLAKTETHSLLAGIDVCSQKHVLPFSVRYQLEVCLSQHCLDEQNIDQDFITRLASLPEIEARDLLEHVAESKIRIYDPMNIFTKRIGRSAESRKIPSYCTYVRSATVTPSTIYFATPTVEISNRITRRYKQYSDRFLRIKFTDERYQGGIYSSDEMSEMEVFTRIKRTLNNGITIGDRHFEFLAFGNSQLRDHGAYFVAPYGTELQPSAIREWMGDFSNINVVAKYAARLGQCFSTTRAIDGIGKLNVVTARDIKRGANSAGNPYNFTDGVGKISFFLAKMVAAEFGLGIYDDPPSVYQFRLGGCKGVLAVSDELRDRTIVIRESLYKFPAVHEGLEIIRYSSFATACLNRQIITVLTTLGVRPEVFLLKQRTMLRDLHDAMTEETTALRMLQKHIDPNQMTLTIASLLLDGFMTSKDPFVMSLLHLWRSWSIKYLKEKARIVIEKGAFLLGCCDETSTLKGHCDVPRLRDGASPKERLHTLPEIFLQVSDPAQRGKRVVITGPCLLARNPSLHPGDVRVVKAIDVPALHHMCDVVVFPTTGDRDLTSMCSGGDLDGDDYLVIWDQELFPSPLRWNVEPMDYTPPSPVTAKGQVTTNDITTFFVNYMRNDKLPIIAHAHLATADASVSGVEDGKCLQLAQLHSLAVDYPKTGVPAELPRKLRAKKWPHFMEKKYAKKENTYHSATALGQLYDQVESVDFVVKFDEPFDKRVMEAHNLDDKLLDSASKVKKEYDTAMRKIMAQHDIRTEQEVWSTFVMNHAKLSSDYKFHEEIGRISEALKDRFRHRCRQEAGGPGFEKLSPYVAAMYVVTAREVRAALEVRGAKPEMNGEAHESRKPLSKNMPLMSFPWLFHKQLGRIAMGETTWTESTLPHKQPRAQRTQEKQMLLLSEGTLPNHRENDIETAQGTTHRGDVLELFDQKAGSVFVYPGVAVPKTASADELLPDQDAFEDLSISRGHSKPETEHTAMVDSGLQEFGEDLLTRAPTPARTKRKQREQGSLSELVEMLGGETSIREGPREHRHDMTVTPTSRSIRSHPNHGDQGIDNTLADSSEPQPLQRSLPKILALQPTSSGVHCDWHPTIAPSLTTEILCEYSGLDEEATTSSSSAGQDDDETDNIDHDINTNSKRDAHTTSGVISDFEGTSSEAYRTDALTEGDLESEFSEDEEEEMTMQDLKPSALNKLRMMLDDE